MKRTIAASCLLLQACSPALADNANAMKNLKAEDSTQNESTPLDIETLFDKARIPRIVVAADGSILVFAACGTLFRRSVDGGKIWSEPEPLDGSGGNVMIDDNTGHALFVCPRENYLLRSKDHGKSWKKEAIVLKANDAGHGTPDGVPVDVTCSESGITLQFGKHKGRLLMPGRICPPDGGTDQKYWPYHYNTAIYSDDGGKTWQTSGPVQSGTGEGTLAELSNGTVYYNSRSHMSVDNRRRIAWSHDGGHMWTDWQVSTYLYEVGQPFYFKYGTKPSYGCNAGLVRVPSEVTGGKDVLLFSTPDNPGKGRSRMTVWASFDGARTWPVKRLVDEGHSVYSSLTADKRGNIYLLFERQGTLGLARFDLEWLTQRQDWRTLLQDLREEGLSERSDARY